MATRELDIIHFPYQPAKQTNAISDTFAAGASLVHLSIFALYDVSVPVEGIGGAWNEENRQEFPARAAKSSTKRILNWELIIALVCWHYMYIVILEMRDKGSVDF